MRVSKAEATHFLVAADARYVDFDDHGGAGWLQRLPAGCLSISVSVYVCLSLSLTSWSFVRWLAAVNRLRLRQRRRATQALALSRELAKFFGAHARTHTHDKLASPRTLYSPDSFSLYAPDNKTI